MEFHMIPFVSRSIIGSLGVLLLAGTAFAQTTPTPKTADSQAGSQPAASSKPVAAPTDAKAKTTADDTAAAAARTKRFVEALRQRFKNADADHDGFLTREEAGHGVPVIARHFDEIDSKHTGKVSLDDFAAYLASQKHPAPKSPSLPLPPASNKAKTQPQPAH
jgi:cytoskeletal protein RodZ